MQVLRYCEKKWHNSRYFSTYAILVFVDNPCAKQTALSQVIWSHTQVPRTPDLTARCVGGGLPVHHNIPLLTNNAKDYVNIDGLVVIRIGN